MAEAALGCGGWWREGPPRLAGRKTHAGSPPGWPSRSCWWQVSSRPHPRWRGGASPSPALLRTSQRGPLSANWPVTRPSVYSWTKANSRRPWPRPPPTWKAPRPRAIPPVGPGGLSSRLSPDRPASAGNRGPLPPGDALPDDPSPVPPWNSSPPKPWSVTFARTPGRYTSGEGGVPRTVRPQILDPGSALPRGIALLPRALGPAGTAREGTGGKPPHLSFPQQLPERVRSTLRDAVAYLFTASLADTSFWGPSRAVSSTGSTSPACSLTTPRRRGFDAC